MDGPPKTVQDGHVVTVRATDLRAGDILALPFGRYATITEVKVGTKFVNLRFSEGGYDGKTRIDKYEDAVLIYERGDQR